MKNLWFKIPQETINKPSTLVEDGKITFTLSPWDVPTAFKSSVIGEDLVIEFKYMSEEKVFTLKEKNAVLKVGNNSGRVYKATIKDFAKSDAQTGSFNAELLLEFIIEPALQESKVSKNNLDALKNFFKSETYRHDLLPA
ncbi:hypothetical protein [Marinospirillum minutulum]|uniref:hypothetical protein n=1 Tax=Marinospirillum minutulum TaxID=64974 RepID=UPI00047FD38A|nr:hypothetical protein [Marinospirillum minutulum]